MRTVALKPVAASLRPHRPIVGILLEQATAIHLPLRVSIDANGVGGPSAGLAFALDVMEELGRNVDGGHRIAATGELFLNGAVGPIGGVKQKTIGARRAGVDAFLVPAGDNAREARKYAHGLRIIPVKSFQQALHALATLPEVAVGSARIPAETKSRKLRVFFVDKPLTGASTAVGSASPARLRHAPSKQKPQDQ